MIGLKIKGISDNIVNQLINRANKLGQGRSAGTIGFVNKSGYITQKSRIVNGGTSGVPFRLLLSAITEEKYSSFLEMVNKLPDNAVVISVKPGKTGLIVSTGGVNLFNLPIVKIGVKNNKRVGVGVLYPGKKVFNLATNSEIASLKSLAALSMEDEKEALRKSTELNLKHLEISKELPVVSIKQKNDNLIDFKNWKFPDISAIDSIDRQFAQNLINKSVEVEQGREIAALGKVNDQGKVKQMGELIVGGMGYIPSRLLISGYKDISDISLREAYTKEIPFPGVIVHSHPGGTGVMHISDIMAGPGTWGRPIIAIGHDENGNIKGANAAETSPELFELATEKEQLDQKFFDINTSKEEVNIRKRRYQIAQEFTDLCKEITIS